MAITAEMIEAAIAMEQSERHPVDQGYFGCDDSYIDYTFDGKLNLERFAEILNQLNDAVKP